MVDSRTLRKLALQEENKEKPPEKGDSSPHGLAATTSYKQQEATSPTYTYPKTPGEQLQSLSFPYLFSVSPRTAVPEPSCS